MPLQIETYNNVQDNFVFNYETIQKNFIGKVYKIIMSQLLFNLIFVTVTILHAPTNKYIIEHRNLIFQIGSIIISGGTVALVHCKDLCRKCPANFIILFSITLYISFTLSVFMLPNHFEQFLITLGLNALMCFALTIFALQTKLDLTVMGDFLLQVVSPLMIVYFGLIFVYEKSISPIIGGIVVPILLTLFLLYHTRLLVGGDQKHIISPEDYIIASNIIYINIIFLQFYIGHYWSIWR